MQSDGRRFEESATRKDDVIEVLAHSREALRFLRPA